MDNRISQHFFSAQSLVFFPSCVFLLLMTFCLCATARAQIYKWVDENGGTHYSQRPPEQGQASGTVGTMPLSQPYTPSHAAPIAQPEAASRATSATSVNGQAESAESAVELFTTSWCGYCKKARAFFDARGVSFVEYDIEKDPAAARRKQQIDSRPGVPLALINGQPIHGYAPSAYEKALR